MLYSQYVIMNVIIAPDLLVDSYFGDGYYPVGMAYINCGGWEKEIIDCPRTDYLSFYTCGRHTLAGVRCYEGIMNIDNKLSLL